MPHEESHVVSALTTLCKQLDIKCLVQVGAADGYEAESIRLATGCRAIAIDGDPRGWTPYPHLEYHYAIIGESDGPVKFYMNNTPELSGTVARGDSTEAYVSSYQSRLDTFCTRYQIYGVDALIIDTEGSTLRVLEGAGAILSNVNLVYAECQHGMTRPGVSPVEDVNSLLESVGMKMRPGLPSYNAGSQGNYTWIREQPST